MKKLFSLFLVYFLVIATSGVGKLQANVIEKDVMYIDVGHDASIDAVAFETVAVATIAEVQLIFYGSTAVVDCYVNAVAARLPDGQVRKARSELTTETRLLIYKVPWRFKTKKIYYAKTFGEKQNSNPRNPGDGLVIEAIV